MLAELEKLGPRYKMGLKAARDPRFQRLPCVHKGTYADDCIIERVNQVTWSNALSTLLYFTASYFVAMILFGIIWPFELSKSPPKDILRSSTCFFSLQIILAILFIQAICLHCKNECTFLGKLFLCINLH